MSKPKNKPAQPGPTAERLKIDADWKDAVKKAVKTPPPKDDGDDEAEEQSSDDGQ